MKKHTIVLLLGIFLSLTGTAHAATPAFPLCANPQGTVEATYNTGTHGIAGNSGTFTGRDTVYKNSESQYTQCFCADNGQGTQTNWLSATGLTQADIAVYTHDGWIYIADGSNWGLTAGPYLAQNSNYSCTSSGGVGGTSTSTTTPSSGSTSSSSPLQAVLSASTQAVVALASTGNITFIIFVIVGSTLLTGIGVLLKKSR